MADKITTHERYLLFREEMGIGTLLEIVIRGHLYVEAALIRLLEQTLRHPEVMNLPRMKFSSKVQLAVALGAIDSTWKPPFDLLNKFRNRFAHNLNSEFTAQDASDLYNSLQSELREFTDLHKPSAEERGWLLLLIDCITALCWVVEIKADIIDETKEQETSV